MLGEEEEETGRKGARSHRLSVRPSAAVVVVIAQMRRRRRRHAEIYERRERAREAQQFSAVKSRAARSFAISSRLSSVRV